MRLPLEFVCGAFSSNADNVTISAHSAAVVRLAKVAVRFRYSPPGRTGTSQRRAMGMVRQSCTGEWQGSHMDDLGFQIAAPPNSQEGAPSTLSMSASRPLSPQQRRPYCPAAAGLPVPNTMTFAPIGVRL